MFDNRERCFLPCVNAGASTPRERVTHDVAALVAGGPVLL